MTHRAQEEGRGKLRSALLKGVFEVGCGVIAGVLALVYAPFGDELHEVLDPTSVTVAGRVLRGQAPASGIVVQLDATATDETGGQGLFWFEDVGKGRHRFDVNDSGALAFSEEFIVPQGVLEYPLEEIDLAGEPLLPVRADALGEQPNPAFVPERTPVKRATEVAAPEPTRLDQATDQDVETEEPQATPEARPTALIRDERAIDDDLLTDEPGLTSGAPTEEPELDSGARTSRRTSDEQATAAPPVDVDLVFRAAPADLEPGMDAGAHRIQVRVEATDDVLTEIDRVTYYLDPSFNPSVVTRYSSEDGFRLSFVTPGTFPLVAKVHFKDGTVVDVRQQISF